MIGNRYWTTGITVSYSAVTYGWWAGLDFYDDGFAEEGSTQGSLGTRYSIDGPNALARAIDLLKADAERLGIDFRPIEGRPPMLYVPGDGEDPKEDLPQGWQRMLAEQAERLGWESAYRVPAGKEQP